MNLRNKQVMQGDVSKLCLLVATLVLGSVSGQAGGLCERGHSWWDRQRSVCIPCSRCDPAHRLAVKFPCELHRDTICQSLYEIHIYPFNTPKRVYNETKDTNPSENSDYDYYEYVNYDGEVSDTDDKSDEVSWGLQASTLALAASGCVVFFVVVVTLSVYHTKQWKVLKQALKSDVKDLSAKLRLMEAGGEPPSEPVVSTDHHLYCNIHVGKDALLGQSSAKKGSGNVYTQEKHSS